MTQLNTEPISPEPIKGAGLIIPSARTSYLQDSSGCLFLELDNLSPEDLVKAAKELDGDVQTADITVDISIRPLLWNGYQGKAYTAVHMLGSDPRIEYCWKDAKEGKFHKCSIYNYFPTQFHDLIRKMDKTEADTLDDVRHLKREVTLDNVLDLIISYKKHYTVEKVYIPIVKFHKSAKPNGNSRSA